jgi:pimeloyl-ACP methyl ester carboxylesterase
MARLRPPDRESKSRAGKSVADKDPRRQPAPTDDRDGGIAMPYAQVRRLRIYWEEEGEGEPLLMIMGLSFSLAMWGNLRRCLAQGFRVIMFDNRCVGKSERPVHLFSIAAMARDAAAVLDAAGAATAHVLGFSMGGMIAQEVALSYPERVRKLILGCTHCGGFKAVRAESAVLRLLMSPLLSGEARLAAMVPLIYDQNTPRERIDADLEVIRANGPSAIGYLLQLSAIVTWHAYGRLPRISAPTLVLHGENDLLVPPENGHILADRIPGAKLVCIPRAGHVFPTDQPAVTCEALQDFLTGRSS